MKGQTHFFGDGCGVAEHNQLCHYCKTRPAQVHGICKECCPCCEDDLQNKIDDLETENKILREKLEEK